MSLDQDIADIVSKYRRIQRIVSSDRFLIAISRANLDERERVETLATSGKEYDLEAWVQQKNRTTEVWLMSLRDLRALASELQIPHYSHLTKAMLQSEVLSYGQKESGSPNNIAREGATHPGPAIGS